MSHAMRKRLPVAVLALVLGSTAAVAVAPARVNGAFPGLAGLIVWAKSDMSSSHIWKMRADGSGKTDLGLGSEPDWSPDGSRILFMDATGLAVMDADGSNVTHILDGPWASPVWSPDGTQIAMSRYVDPTNGYDLFVANSDGTNAVDITNHSGDDSDVSWSPDGSHLAFWTNRNAIHEIWSVEPNGANQTDLMTGTEGWSPDWSPDGSRIAYAKDGIWVMNADGSNKTQVSTQPADTMPAWSPDGTKIVLGGNGSLNQEIYVMAANGTGRVRLTTDNDNLDSPPYDAYPAWQPLAFTLTTTSMGFGNVVPGSPSLSKSVTLTAGPEPITVTSASLSGDDAADFDITSDTCSGVAVAAFGSCSVGVRFDPLTVGAKTASLDFTGPDPLGTASVGVTGTGRLFLWGTTHYAGPAYTWNFGSSLGGTVSGSTTYLHATYTTDRVGGKWVTDKGPFAGVYYIRSTNAGTTWTAPKRLNPSTQHGSRGSLATSGTYVYATWVSTTRWVSYSGTAPRILYFRRNTFHGSATKWSSTIRLTSKTGRVDFPVVAASGTYVYVAYTDSATGAIKVARSGNRGATWSTVTVGTTTKTSGSGRNGFPEIAAYGSTVAVTWVSSSTNTAKARISTTHGSTWGTAVTLGTTSDVPDVAAVGDRVGVVWTSGGVNVQIATGGVWGSAGVLPLRDGYDTEEQIAPAISLLGSTEVGIAYTSTGTAAAAADIASRRMAMSVTPRDVTPTATSLVWRESTDNGATWAPSDVVAAPTHTRWDNDSPSIYWRLLRKPFVMWNGWTPNSTSYRLYIRTAS